MVSDTKTIWLKTERKRAGFEKIYTAKFKRMLNKQFEAIADSITPENYSSDMISFDEAQTAKVFTDLYKTVGIYFARDVYNGLKADPEQIYDQWNESMRDYSENIAGERIVSINRETRKQALKIIRDAIDEGTQQGLGSAQIASLIRDALREEGVTINYWRSLRIARTEVMTASNAGSIMGARSLGQPMTKMWIATPYGKYRPEHLALDGTEIDINDKFPVGPVGMDAPHDPNGGADQVINCRCTIAFKVKRI